MLIIGSTLASIPFKKVFTQWRLYPVTVIKLLIVPVVTWLVLRLFIHDALMLGILVVLSGMPTATSATMISMEYGGNERLASTGVFITTLFSLASIPALVFVLLT
jgi:predicted permease